MGVSAAGTSETTDAKAEFAGRRLDVAVVITVNVETACVAAGTGKAVQLEVV